MKRITLLTLFLIQMFANLGQALAGGHGDGGGEAVGYDILDRVVARNIKILSTFEVIQSRSKLLEVLAKADEKAYRFSSWMTSNKKWLFISNANPKIFLNCKNGTPIVVEKTVVGCQQKLGSIIIDADWFNNKKTSETVRSALVAHEIFVGIAQFNKHYDKEDTKRSIEFEIQLFNGRVFNGIEPSFNDLAEIMAKLSGKDSYSAISLLTVTEGQNLRAEAIQEVKSFCLSDIKKTIQNPIRGEILTEEASAFYLRAMSGKLYTLHQAALDEELQNIYRALNNWGALVKPSYYQLMCDLVK